MPAARSLAQFPYKGFSQASSTTSCAYPLMLIADDGMDPINDLWREGNKAIVELVGFSTFDCRNNVSGTLCLGLDMPLHKPMISTSNSGPKTPIMLPLRPNQPGML